VAVFEAHDGLPIAASVSPGKPEIVFAHATGFCKEVWSPVTRRLPGAGVLAIDQRGHGDSGLPSAPFDWWDLGRDVLTILDSAGWREPIGAGHSSGAAALILAELLRPGAFSSLVLIEPIVFPPPYVRYEELPLAVAAERRRSSFATRDAAVAAFRGRGPFARWIGEALEAYVDGGFREEEGRWALKCRPEVEAEWYRTATLHGAWSRLGEVACPAIVVGGSESDSHAAAFLEEQAGRLGDASVAIVPGATHFVPMEAPDAVAALISTRAVAR
jgi:pimeloyl-ACP methyl ester carboxylesterase